MTAIDNALEALGFTSDGPPTIEQTPKVDARFDALSDLIEELLLVPAGSDATPAFRDDERLVVFTEYKTTLDYLERRLRGRYGARVLTLFGSGGAGGMDDADRNRVREAFNDPDSEVRILIATDAASEGLNLHRSARYLLHYDCPWNPSRLEQRNGRLDRYGQARDVTVHHFLSDDDPDLKFLDHVIRKANEIREDLGSVNELFDVAAHRRLIKGEDLARVQFDLTHGLTQEVDRLRSQGIPGLSGAAPGSAGIRPAARSQGTRASCPHPGPAGGTRRRRRTRRRRSGEASGRAGNRDRLRSQGAPTHARSGHGGGRPRPTATRPHSEAGDDFWRLLRPDLPGWRDTIDESVRQQRTDGVQGGIRSLAFDPDSLLRQVGGRGVFSPRPEVALLHLAHPMIERALRVLTQCRLPGPAERARWTVRRGGVPRGVEALILLSLEELAVNELRETFHHWVRTITLPVQGGVLGKRQRHAPARNLAASARALGTDAGNGSPPDRAPTPAEHDLARTIFLDVEAELEAVVTRHAEDLTESLREQLQVDGKEALKREDERYRSRQGEVSELIEQTRIQRLEREIDKLRREQQQRLLFDQRRDLERIAGSIQEKQREIEHRRRHYEDAREQLERERRRIVDRLLPKRHALAGKAKAFPVAIEVRLP